MIEERYQLWMKTAKDPDVLKELAAMDAVKKENSFFKELEFGTGGLRGEIGAGTNCLNLYTIRKATAGVAAYLSEHGGKRVAVSYDSRIKSDLFATTAAEVFAAYGLSVLFVPELMPTPYLSFLTRIGKCDAGVMITASHNPGRYNGYKVYGADGCQITDAAAKAIIEQISKVDCFAVKTATFEEYRTKGLIEFSGENEEEEFLRLALTCGANENLADLSVTYTPLNGTGWRIVPKALKLAGLTKLSVVKEQAHPDGNFPTCPYPNPEKKEALALGLTAAQENGTDLLLATDPDADRVGVAVKGKGGYRLMTGNEIGVLLLDYLLAGYRGKDKPVVIKTIVTTELGRRIAAEYGAEMIEVLTGFKYIGEQIGLLEKKNQLSRYVVGFEESYGYLAGTYVRDKDAVGTCVAVCRMAAHYKGAGKTLADRIEEIYRKYGKYEHRLVSYEFPGASGNEKMKNLLRIFRENLPREIAGKKVLKVKDYAPGFNGLPPANVLSFELEGGAQLIVRPSGTEPQIKMYLTVSRTAEENERDLIAFKRYLDETFA